MNMVWHDHKGMQHIVFEHGSVVLDCFDDHVRDGRLAKVECSGAGFVQQTIHGGEGFPGSKSF